MPLIHHFYEIKYRFIYVSISFLMSFLVCFCYSEQLVFFTIKPLVSLPQMNGRHMIFTEMSEAFETYIHICFIISSMIIIPFIFYQVWCFWIPSTYFRERIQFTSILLYISLGLLCSCYFIYSIALPEIWSFFLQFETNNPCLNIELEARIHSYVALTCKIVGILLVLLQCPLYTHFALEAQVLTPRSLQASRKYVFFCFLLVAAFLSPPDIYSQLSISFALAFIYECCLYYAFYHLCSSSFGTYKNPIETIASSHPSE